MALSHRCPDGVDTVQVRTGPIGQDGTFTCPRCGDSQTGEQIMSDFNRVRSRIVARMAHKDREATK